MEIEFKLRKEFPISVERLFTIVINYRCLRLKFVSKVYMACFVGAVVMTLVHFQAEDVTPEKLTSMAVDIASGLAYLAEMKFVLRYAQCLLSHRSLAWRLFG